MTVILQSLEFDTLTLIMVMINNTVKVDIQVLSS